MIMHFNVVAEDISSELDSGKVLYMGLDNEERPLYLVRAAKHFPPNNAKGFARESTQKVLVAAFRFAVTQMKAKVTKFSLVADLSGFGWANIDTGILQALGDVYESLFQGRLHRLYIVNSPFFVRGLWRCLKPLMSQKV